MKIKFFKLQKQFKARIVYKSGYTHDFWSSSFSITGDTYSWDAVEINNRPIKLGVEDIAAVYQVGTRTRIIWG